MSIDRRTFVTLPILALADASAGESASSSGGPIQFAFNDSSQLVPLRRESFSTVGLYDIDWLVTPEFESMLDLMASSPGAIGGVRFFGIFTAADTEAYLPESSGEVWIDPAREPDFSLPFAALEALTTRGLKPFIALGFFPPAVSPSPIVPPKDYLRWKRLVQSFLIALRDDARFGESEIATWYFEVWNEPNEGRFWSGNFEDYLELYRSIAEAVNESGVTISLGGPAMAYKPESEAEDGPEAMASFLAFLADHPDMQCDFISYHRKGTVDQSHPDPRRLLNAAQEISALIHSIVPERAESLGLINNEADEKIGFEVPYSPRMDAFAASWLTTLVSSQLASDRDNLGRGGPNGASFQDNLNLQLMEAPFDGRRSIYVPAASDDRTDLLKTSGSVWYDLLPIVEGDAITCSHGAERLFPQTDLHLVVTRNVDSAAVLATFFPVVPEASGTSSETIVLTDLPWDRVNTVEFRIDAEHSNSYRTAGGSDSNPSPTPTSDDLASIRVAQELCYGKPPRHDVAVVDGRAELEIRLEPFQTSCFWVTPFDRSPIDAPGSIKVVETSFGILVRWDSVIHRQLLGYELARRNETGELEPVTRDPIRPTQFRFSNVDQTGAFAVRSVSCSGMVSDWLFTL